MTILPPLLPRLAENLADTISKKYRVDHERAMALVMSDFEKKPELLALVASASQLKEVTRTRLYKTTARDVTRKMYYTLRRYQAEDSIDHLLQELAQASSKQALEQVRHALVKNHVSTAERLSHSREFWAVIASHWNKPQSILDVGCGILPLLFPFYANSHEHTHNHTYEHNYAVEHYLALDRSEDSIRTIQAFQQAYQITGLDAKQWSIAQGWSAVVDAEQVFDVAFLLKLIPVIARQEPALLTILAQTPAYQLIVTGCKYGMVKQKDISRREKAVVFDFIKQAGFKLQTTFETPDEIGFLLNRD